MPISLPPRPKPHTPNPIIIALTASALEHEREAILRAGCNDIVVKPFWEATIFEKLAEHLQVEFTYEVPEPAGEPEPPPVELIQALGSLPPEIVRDLYQALVAGNVKTANQTVDRVSQHDATLARELRKMVKNCQFDELLDLLETDPARL